MRYLVLIGLFFSLSGRGLAQPGAFGGSLRFRLFDPQGRLIGPGRADYQCFPSWDSLSLPAHMREHPERWQFARTFTYGRDGYWQYQSLPTPAGGLMPANFTLVVVHGRDTMRIRGLGDGQPTRYEPGLQVNSIPFGPGRYWVPATYVNLLSVQAVGGRIVNSGWDFFRDPTARPDRITTERLPQPQEAGPPPDSAAACSRLLLRYTPANEHNPAEPGWSAVYLARGKQKPKLLLRHLAGHPNLLACAGSRLLLVIDEGTILKSEDEGATWRVCQLRDEVTTRWNGYLSHAPELDINRLWAEGGRVFAQGSRRWPGAGNTKPSALYELHFTQDTASVVVRRSRAQTQRDFKASLAWEQQQKKNRFLESVRAAIAESQNQALARQGLLRRGWFGQADPYVRPLAELKASPPPANPLLHAERPLVTLQDGRFQYDGTVWVATPWDNVDKREVAAFKLSGTYTATDSTLTFRAPPARQLPPDATKTQYSFYPVGTYYYHFYQSPYGPELLIILERWNEAGGYATQMDFRLHR